MRLAFMAFVAATWIAVSGCHHNLARNGCGHCRCQHGGWGHASHAHKPARVAPLPHGYLDDQRGPYGPPTASYGYPYYTIRAPRDFLLDNPPSIGY